MFHLLDAECTQNAPNTDFSFLLLSLQGNTVPTYVKTGEVMQFETKQH
jgi:hypothetical protein